MLVRIIGQSANADRLECLCAVDGWNDERFDNLYDLMLVVERICEAI